MEKCEGDNNQMLSISKLADNPPDIRGKQSLLMLDNFHYFKIIQQKN